MTLVETSFFVELLRGSSGSRGVGIRLAGSSLAVADIAHGYADRSIVRIAHGGRITRIR